MVVDPDLHARVDAKFRLAGKAWRLLQLAIQSGLFLWACGVFRTFSRPAGGSPSWVWDWQWEQVLPSLGGTALTAGVATGFFRAEHALKRKIEYLDLLSMQQAGNDQPGPALVTSAHLQWLQGAAWLLRTARQSMTLIGFLEMTQLVRVEDLFASSTGLKAALLGTLLWQMLSSLWRWGFSPLQAET